MRMNELIAGVRAKWRSRSMATYGTTWPKWWRDRGAGEAYSGSVRRGIGAGSRPAVMDDHAEPEALGSLGLSIDDVQAGGRCRRKVAAIAAAKCFEGDRRFDIVVRLPEAQRKNRKRWASCPIPVTGRRGLGGEQATILGCSAASTRLNRGWLAMVPQISREERGKRRVGRTSNVCVGRDLGFVRGGVYRDQVSARIELPEGYWVDYGGTSEQLISAGQRLSVGTRGVGHDLGLLFMASARPGMQRSCSRGIPLALDGGVAALWLRDIRSPISAGVGFIRAVRRGRCSNGLVDVSFIRRLSRPGAPLHEPILNGAQARLASGADGRRWWPAWVLCPWPLKRRHGCRGATAARYRFSIPGGPRGAFFIPDAVTLLVLPALAIAGSQKWRATACRG